jgi:hypothetical protein
MEDPALGEYEKQICDLQTQISGIIESPDFELPRLARPAYLSLLYLDIFLNAVALYIRNFVRPKTASAENTVRYPSDSIREAISKLEKHYDESAIIPLLIQINVAAQACDETIQEFLTGYEARNPAYQHSNALSNQVLPVKNKPTRVPLQTELGFEDNQTYKDFRVCPLSFKLTFSAGCESLSISISVLTLPGPSSPKL